MSFMSNLTATYTFYVFLWTKYANKFKRKIIYKNIYLLKTLSLKNLGYQNKLPGN